jgi:GNAT superfamily N-acetyltransferase
MTDGILIRPVGPADRKPWRELWDGYNAFYGRTGPTALAAEITDSTWSRFFEPEEPVWALVAAVAGEDGGERLIGLVHYLFHRSTSAIADNCYLQDLYVAPEMRGLGVGRALIEAVYDKAREAGAGRVYWLTHQTNPARKLYDEVADDSGFVMYRRTLGA